MMLQRLWSEDHLAKLLFIWSLEKQTSLVADCPRGAESKKRKRAPEAGPSGAPPCAVLRIRPPEISLAFEMAGGLCLMVESGLRPR